MKNVEEYIEEALKRAKYEIIEDEEPYYGEVEELEGVWATGKTLEECRENLREAIKDWVIFSIKNDFPPPQLKKPYKISYHKTHAFKCRINGK